MTTRIVLPGEMITNEVGFLRGHGTYVLDGVLFASVAGIVERVNRLISVKPLKSNYNGEVGDVVVGRITDVLQTSWRVDVNGRQSCSLALSAVSLYGVQRRKNAEDALQMRSTFKENDIISAEVQQIHNDGQLALHTRLKYGKLSNGQLITVPSSLIKRVKNHFYSFPFGVDVILGNNGNIWISDTFKRHHDESDFDQEKIEDTPRDIPASTREKISRVRNCIEALAMNFISIYPESIMETYDESLQKEMAAKDILQAENASEITQRARLL